MVTGFTVPSRVICRINIIQLRRRVDGAACHPFSTRLYEQVYDEKSQSPLIARRRTSTNTSQVSPEPARTTLNKVRAVIRSAVPPEATEAISYGIPTFKYEGSLVAFAAFRRKNPTAAYSR